MFTTDITTLVLVKSAQGQSHGNNLREKDTPYQTDEGNTTLAADIQRYLRAMQEGKNIRYSTRQRFILVDCRDHSWIYRHTSLAQEITTAKREKELLPKRS